MILTHLAAFIGGTWAGTTAAVAVTRALEAMSRRHNQHLTDFADLFSDDDDPARVHFQLWERGL